MTKVYVSPARNLWVVLRHEEGRAVCLRLDTGEVKEMSRSIEELVRWGWREWSEENAGTQ